MLRAVDSAERPRPAPYRVPWHVNRDDPAHPLLRNESADQAEYVRVYVTDGTGPPGIATWGRVRPGEARELCLCDRDLDDTTITIAWFLPDDDREWAWSFVV
jgi:hypothetical protein